MCKAESPVTFDLGNSQAYLTLCMYIYIDRSILHPSLLTVRHRAARNYTVIAISFNYFLPDPCNSSDTEPVTQNEREREEREGREEENDEERVGSSGQRALSVNCK